MKIRLKRRIATRSGKGNQPLNTKTAVERPTVKLGLPNFRWSLHFFTSRCTFYDVTHDTLQRFMDFQNSKNKLFKICYLSVTLG